MDAGQAAAAAAVCSTVVAITLFVLSHRMKGGPRKRTRGILDFVASACILTAVLSTQAAISAYSEIDEGQYALLTLSMTVDHRLVPIVQAAMKDGRITNAEYRDMKYHAAIPTQKDMRQIMSSVVGPVNAEPSANSVRGTK